MFEGGGVFLVNTADYCSEGKFWEIQTPDTVWVTKRHQNVKKKKLKMESMGPKLSKSGLRMFLRCLVRDLCSEVVT